MKPYIKPTLKVFEFESNEIMTGSGNIGFNPTPTDDCSPQIRRNNGWDEYEQ